MSTKQMIVVQEEQAIDLQGQEPVQLTEYLVVPEPKPSPVAEASILTKEVPGQKSQLFTVRMWPEPLGTGQIEWRGKVDHVTSGEGYAFRDWDRLIVYLEKMLQPGFRTAHGVG
jgi:hypothetical protein